MAQRNDDKRDLSLFCSRLDIGFDVLKDVFGTARDLEPDLKVKYLL